jgi:DUF1365 family protein
VHHRRAVPNVHAFKYRLFFMFLDLDDLPGLFDRRWLWSARRPALAWFRREDHLVGSGDNLADDIRSLVETQTGRRPDGKIFLLTHLRYFGYVFNPLSVYYCYENDGTLGDVILEVSNTPWGERHWYVLPRQTNRAQTTQRRLHDVPKKMHVSPFLPMDMRYRLRANAPADQLSLSLSNWQGNRRVFKADLALNRRELSPARLNLMLLKFPFLTLRVTMAIHWQALRLWLKKTPFLTHPDKQTKTSWEELR